MIITLIVCFIFGCAFVAWEIGTSEKTDYYPAPGLAFMFGVFLGGLLVGLPMFIAFNVEPESEFTETEVPIVAAADGQTTEASGSGAFVFVSFSAETGEVYNYFEPVGENRYARGQISVEDAIIVEDNSVEPHILKTCEYSVTEGVNPWYEWGFNTRIAKDCEYEIFVPVGSVVNQFNFDLE